MMTERSKKKLPPALLNLLKSSGVSSVKIAKALGMSQSSVWTWLNAGEVPVDRLNCLIAAVLFPDLRVIEGGTTAHAGSLVRPSLFLESPSQKGLGRLSVEVLTSQDRKASNGIDLLITIEQGEFKTTALTPQAETFFGGVASPEKSSLQEIPLENLIVEIERRGFGVTLSREKSKKVVSKK